MESQTHLASKFGVEIETRIKGLEGADPPDIKEDDTDSPGIKVEKKMKRWGRHVGPLGDALALNEVANHLTVDQYEKVAETYEQWYLTPDDSIVVDKLWGVELVSPVFDYPNRHSWKAQLSRVYGVLNDAPFFSEPNKTCALHVHVSIEPTWTVERVRRLAKAILHYMPQFEQLASKVGRTGAHMQEQAIPNSVKVDGSSSSDGSRPSMEAVQKYLDGLETIRDIVKALCPADERMMWTQDGVRPPRHYFWNLWPLVGLGFEENEYHYFVKKTGTVEFRIPPSPKTEQQVAAWIDLVNLFVLTAVDGDSPSGNSLVSFVQFWSQHSSGVSAGDLLRVEHLFGEQE